MGIGKVIVGSVAAALVTAAIALGPLVYVELRRRSGLAERGATWRLGPATLLASIASVLAVVTVFWPSWIERTGWDPDANGGAAEWIVATAFFLLAIGLRLRDRRPRSA